MKIADVLADGTVYWFDRTTDWGTYLRSDYSRHPVVRVDDKRYQGSGLSFRPSFREDTKGRFVRVREVAEDGSPVEGAQEHHILATQIRATMKDTRERYDKRKAAADAAEQQRADRTAEVAQRAADLRARLEGLGIDSIKVGHTTGQGWNAGLPHVTVDLGYSPADVLADLLDRLESGRHAERELAARKRDMTPDPDFADRLANGAYER